MSVTKAEGRVLLANPPAPPGMVANREGAGGLGAVGDEGGFAYPPQTLAAAAAVVRAAGWQVTAYDAPTLRMSVEDLAERLASEQPTIVGLLVSAMTLQGDLAVLQTLAQRYPAARYLLFGPALRAIARLLPKGIAVALDGEPEGLLPAACARLATGEAVDEAAWSAADLVPGAELVDGLVPDLDALPLPAWDLLGAERYPFLTLQASRGCGHACLYCPYVVAQGRHLRLRQPERVLAELRWLRQSFRPGRIVFREPAFAYDREHAAAICRGIAADPALRPRTGSHYWWWECESRPEHIDRDLLHLMARAGCLALKIGLETVNAALLCSMGRVAGPEAAGRYRRHTATVVEECRRAGIVGRLFVMVGLPGETEQTVAETADFIRQVRPDEVLVKQYVPYPGLAWLEGHTLPAIEETEAHYTLLRSVAREVADSTRRSGRRWHRLRWLRRR